MLSAGQTADDAAPCPNACGCPALIALSATAKVLLVLVAPAPLVVGIVWFRVAASEPERRTTAVARGVLWVVIAVGLATAALGPTIGLYAAIIPILVLPFAVALTRQRHA